MLVARNILYTRIMNEDISRVIPVLLSEKVAKKYHTR